MGIENETDSEEEIATGPLGVRNMKRPAAALADGLTFAIEDFW